MSINYASFAVVGAGISGITAARLLADLGHNVTIFEKAETPGGLIRCSYHGGALFHRVGGHVFNSKDEKVLNWFQQYFDIDNEFLKADRNAAIYLDGEFVPYPIELNLSSLPEPARTMAINDLVQLAASSISPPPHSTFRKFLLENFGKTLCDLYFFGYNEKIWKTDLSTISTKMLEGKLPMSSPMEIIRENIKGSSDSMVHSQFYYPRRGGSQFLVDRLCEGLRMTTEHVKTISVVHDKFIINQDYGSPFDQVIYTGDIRQLNLIADDLFRNAAYTCTALLEEVTKLRSHGTTTMLCECDNNPYSWIYLPSKILLPHRIIMTGNFSPANNPSAIPEGRTTCTVECTGLFSETEMERHLYNLPLKMHPIAYNYCDTTYVVHDSASLVLVSALVDELSCYGFHCVGRFGEWQYYNMDASIASAMRTVEKIRISL